MDGAVHGSGSRSSVGASRSNPPPSRELPRPSGNRYLIELDGVRALAALAVVAFHSTAPMFSSGHVGVTVFFVLSGFLITELLLREAASTGAIRLRRFWIRRLGRLWPALLLMSAAGAALTVVRHEAWFWPTSSTVFYFSNVWTYLQHPMGAFYHTWTLAIEEQFYLIWPVVLLFTRRRPVRLALAAILLAVALALPVHGVLGALQASWRLALGLPLGCALALLRPRHPSCRAAQRLAPAAGALLLVGAALGWFGDKPEWRQEIVPALLSLVLIAGLVTGDSVLNRALSMRCTSWVGQRSYSLYLWHVPVLLMVRGLPPFEVPWPAELVAGLALSIVVAHLSYTLLETPVRTWVNARVNGRATTPRAGDRTPA